MITKYSNFIKENLQKSKSILSSKLKDYDNLKSFLLSKNSMGYMGKFTELLFGGIPYNEIITLYNDIVDLKSKNIKFNVDSYDKYEEIIDSINSKKIDYKFKYIFNQFPKEQKELISTDDKDIVLTFSKLYDIPDNNIFIKKISRYKEEDDMINAIEMFIKAKSKSYSREYVKSLIGEDIILSFENENIIIVKVKTWSAIKEVGDDTSWCIVSNESQFKSYTKENRSQFVIFDYTKEIFESEFKIGFTVDVNDKIITAHDILDKYAVKQVEKILKENNVNISTINIKKTIDVSKLSDKTSFDDLKSIIKSYKLEKDTIDKLLRIISKKIEFHKYKYNALFLIEMIFKSTYNGFITEEEFDSKYKQYFSESASNVIKIA